VLTRFSSQVNGLTGVAVTKLDVLDTLPELQVATAYRMSDGSVVSDFPADTRSLVRVQPVYETLPGWQAPTGEARRLEDLPAAARRYLHRLEELTEAPVRWVSVGSKRDQIIEVG
jgi:adenylosuccinate synthase